MVESRPVIPSQPATTERRHDAFTPYRHFSH